MRIELSDPAGTLMQLINNPSVSSGCASVCPVCGAPCGLKFTSGKGKPYLACDAHKIEAILLAVHGDPRRYNNDLSGTR